MSVYSAIFVGGHLLCGVCLVPGRRGMGLGRKIGRLWAKLPQSAGSDAHLCSGWKVSESDPQAAFRSQARGSTPRLSSSLGPSLQPDPCIAWLTSFFCNYACHQTQEQGQRDDCQLQGHDTPEPGDLNLQSCLSDACLREAQILCAI